MKKIIRRFETFNDFLEASLVVPKKQDSSSSRQKESASVVIRMRDGKTYQDQVLYPLGDDRRNPMSQTQIEDKFRDCASFSLKPMSSANIEQVIKLVADLENVPDVAMLTRWL